MEMNIGKFILLIGAITGSMVLPIFLVLHLFKRKTRDRKSPLNIALLRSPGESLNQQILEKTVDITGYSTILPLIGAMLYINHITSVLVLKLKSDISVPLHVIMGVGVCIYTFVKVYKLYHERNLLRLGYECEVAVGQDLTQLVKHGFKIFHDFPANGFNIDHIVIGPSGVFAIETKGRSKQTKVEKENWKLSFDGETLQFPNWCETKPVEQAKRQAQWLSKWINSSTGEPQPVMPVLAFPGWFTINTKPFRDIKLYNGKNSEKVFEGRPVLNEKRINTIAFQVEGKCRDVELKSYKKG